MTDYEPGFAPPGGMTPRHLVPAPPCGSTCHRATVPRSIKPSENGLDLHRALFMLH